ncbi:MAG TPA: M28 family peptidase [Vicinamibacterales bacterium]|nr:M28 family peptidase [Vicinamibacterales bacterium]
MSKLSVLSACLFAACLSAAQPAARFDGDRAFAHVRRIVEIGPRPAGSEGAARTREYITTQLRALGLTVAEQSFEAQTPLGPIRTVNLRAMVPGTNGTAGPRLVIAGHYDTKLFRDFAFVGANDGGSSAAFLIELARVLKDGKRALPIELVFFDGEEAVIEWVDNDHTYGSRHYVDEARRNGTLKDIRAMILVDMIGDRDLRIMRDTNSTPWLTDIFWDAAKRLGRREFVDEALDIQDDHIPFLQAGVPAVDIIDLDYPAWHTEADTIDRVSGQSLQVVGDVLLAALPDVIAHIGR